MGRESILAGESTCEISISGSPSRRWRWWRPGRRWRRGRGGAAPVEWWGGQGTRRRPKPVEVDRGEAIGNRPPSHNPTPVATLHQPVRCSPPPPSLLPPGRGAGRRGRCADRDHHQRHVEERRRGGRSGPRARHEGRRSDRGARRGVRGRLRCRRGRAVDGHPRGSRSATSRSATSCASRRRRRSVQRPSSSRCPAWPRRGRAEPSPKQLTLEQLIAWREAQRARRRTVVWTKRRVRRAPRRPPRIAARRPPVRRRARRRRQRRRLGPREQGPRAADLSLRGAGGAASPPSRSSTRSLVFDDATPERVLARCGPTSTSRAPTTRHRTASRSRSAPSSRATGGRIEFLRWSPATRRPTRSIGSIDSGGRDRLDHDPPCAARRSRWHADRRRRLSARPRAGRALPGAIDALQGLQARFSLVIVSNQSGIGRGLVTPAEAAAVHDRTVAVSPAPASPSPRLLLPARSDAGCPCRKPAPGLLLDAARDLGLDPSPARSCSATRRPISRLARPPGAATRSASARHRRRRRLRRCDDWPASPPSSPPCIPDRLIKHCWVS